MTVTEETMKPKHAISRRDFLQLGASFGMLAALGEFKLSKAAPVQDYKALVCIFMLGGNDGHNVVVPLSGAQYNAYTAARGGLALPPNQLPSITYPTLGPVGLNYAMPELHALLPKGKMGVGL